MNPLEQIPFADLVTPAGIVVAAALVRQIVEIVKGFDVRLSQWIDAGNERKTAIIAAALLYAGWSASYARTLPDDAWTAFFSFVAVAIGAIGTDQALTAVKATIAANVAPEVEDIEPVLES